MGDAMGDGRAEAEAAEDAARQRYTNAVAEAEAVEGGTASMGADATQGASRGGMA